MATDETDALSTKNTGGRLMKARVHVMLKDGVLDPQGEAVRHALGSLGFDAVNGVRQGKVIELDLAETDEAAARETVTAMCEKAARQHGHRELPHRSAELTRLQVSCVKASIIVFPGSNCPSATLAVALCKRAGFETKVSMVWHKETDPARQGI